MDWLEYKKLCDQPNYWSHWMLNQCLELIEHTSCLDLVAAIQQTLASLPLHRPADHTGPQSTFMYKFTLSLALSELLLSQVQRAHNINKTTAATQTRGLAGFVVTCEELVDYLRLELAASSEVDNSLVGPHA